MLLKLFTFLLLHTMQTFHIQSGHLGPRMLPFKALYHLSIIQTTWIFLFFFCIFVFKRVSDHTLKIHLLFFLGPLELFSSPNCWGVKVIWTLHAIFVTGDTTSSKGVIVPHVSQLRASCFYTLQKVNLRPFNLSFNSKW